MFYLLRIIEKQLMQSLDEEPENEKWNSKIKEINMSFSYYYFISYEQISNDRVREAPFSPVLLWNCKLDASVPTGVAFRSRILKSLETELTTSE